MTCPYHDDADSSSTDDEPEPTMRPADERGVDRREFMKSALAIGGASALSTTIGMYGMPGTARADGEDPIGIAERANRQHAWDAFEQSARGTTVPPEHHLVLSLDYQHDGEPSPGHRREVEGAFRQLEAAFGWRYDGLLFTVGYSPEYFDRFEADLPPGLEPADGNPTLVRAESMIDAISLPREDIAADTYDACLHLASDHVQHLLAAEEALWGERDEINGVTIEADFVDIFDRPREYPRRRTGFAGRENVVGNLESDTEFEEPEERIPEEADLSMGFNALFDNSVPAETNVTLLEDQAFDAETPLPPGSFAQGTVEHVSTLDIDLDSWYDDYDLDERRSRMFSPEHTEDGTGVAGEELGESNAPADGPKVREAGSEETDLAERTEADASEGAVGHVQKLARGRFDLENRMLESVPEDDPAVTDGDEQALETPMLRRDFDTTDRGTPGLHFISLMRLNGYMTYIRQAMNGIDFDTATFGLDGADRIDHESTDIDDEENGIVGFLDTQRRGNFLVPPLTLRSLPFPRALSADLSVDRDGDTYVVEIEPEGDSDRIDAETLRFGHYRAVNRGSGVEPSDVSTTAGTLIAEFPVDGTGLEDDDGAFNNALDRARLAGKTQGSRRAVRGTTEL